MIFDELHHIQQTHGHLPADDLRKLSQRVRAPLYRIHSVASFYPHFHLASTAEVRVGMCGDMVCHLRGADRLRERVQCRTAAAGSRVAVGHVSCLGQCDRAPAVAVNDHIFAHADEDRVVALIGGALEGQDLADLADGDEQSAHLSEIAWP